MTARLIRVFIEQLKSNKSIIRFNDKPLTDLQKKQLVTTILNDFDSYTKPWYKDEEDIIEEICSRSV